MPPPHPGRRRHADNLEILQLRLESQGYEVITGRRRRGGARDVSELPPDLSCSTS